MKPELVVLLMLSVFMLHEFEEIIFVMPWLTRHRDDPRVAAHPFEKFRRCSTSTVAVLIFEEFLLYACVASLTEVFGWYTFFTGFLSFYSLHLLVHIVEPIRFHCLTASLLTSLITLPVCIYGIVSLARSGQVVFLWCAVWFIVSGAITLANLNLMHRLAPGIERRIRDYAGE